LAIGPQYVVPTLIILLSPFRARYASKCVTIPRCIVASIDTAAEGVVSPVDQ
jgi:hypothetical protein